MRAVLCMEVFEVHSQRSNNTNVAHGNARQCSVQASTFILMTMQAPPPGNPLRGPLHASHLQRQQSLGLHLQGGKVL